MPKTKRNPFGGNPFGAPSLPFNKKIPSPFERAKDFDVALGLSDPFAGIQDNPISDFDGFSQRPRQRKNRKRQFSVERQERILSGQEPLSVDEQINIDNDRDFFGSPRTE